MTITFIGANTAGGNLATVSPTWPAVQAGDLALVVWTFSSARSQTDPTDFGLPLVDVNGGAGTMTACLYRKVCSGSETGSLALTNDLANRQSGILAVYRGVDPTTPIEPVPATDTSHTTGTTHNNPTYTPVVGDCAILTTIHERASSIDTAWTPPSGYTERADTLTLATGSGGTITALADDGLTVNNPSGTAQTPGVWTGDHGTGTNGIVTMTFALRPLGHRQVRLVLPQAVNRSAVF